MAEKMRYNKIIDLLERGKPVFSTSTVPNGNLDDLTYISDADYDAVIIEMEYEGFSFTTLRTSLQVLLNRKRIAEKGNLQPDVVPMVRTVVSHAPVSATAEPAYGVVSSRRRD